MSDDFDFTSLVCGDCGVLVEVAKASDHVSFDGPCPGCGLQIRAAVGDSPGYLEGLIAGLKARGLSGDEIAEELRKLLGQPPPIQ